MYFCQIFSVKKYPVFIVNGKKLCFFDFSCFLFLFYIFCMFFILDDNNDRHNDEVNLKIGINKRTLAARITDSPSIYKKN